MKPILSLPCKNKHSEMEKLDQGYHCKDCNHVVTDFRNSTNEEIRVKIQQNPGKICGIFKRDQFDYKVSQVQVPAFRAVGLSLLGVLGFLGPVLTSCESDPAAVVHKQNAFNLLKFPLHVKGTVKDEKTGKPLPYFKVEVLQHNRLIKTVKTDKDGNFDIVVRKEDLNQEIFKLAIGGKEYKRDTLVSNITKYGKNNKVKLTIKAEAIAEIETLGIPPMSVEKKCRPVATVEGIVREELEIMGGIPSPEYIEPQIVYPEQDVYEIPVIEPDPIIYSTYKPGKTRKIKEKKVKKHDNNAQDSIR